MNSPEKKIIHLALCLFVLGVLVRILPWGLPSIEMIQIEDRSPVSTNLPAPDSAFLNKVTEMAGEEVAVLSDSGSRRHSQNKEKKKKTKKKVVLPLHINAASAEDLCALNGVGPKLADKIIAHREASGPFKSPKDLEKVQGIGKKKLESILPGVIFD